MTDQSSLLFNNAQTWSQRVLSADAIYAQVKSILEEQGKDLPLTPRRPDIRLILENNSGVEIKFLNPGDHAKEQTETIPASGDSKAVMVMLKGGSLERQFANAKALADKFDLHSKGLTKEFAMALGTDATTPYVDEAYGPAPFEGQADKLVPLSWTKQSGSSIEVAPIKTDVCAYGSRQAEDQTVFATEIVIFVKGTGTIAECVEGTGMCVAVSSDWETGKISTRPIVPSVAKEFYGAFYDGMPEVSVDVEGNVQSIDLKNGDAVVKVAPKSNGYMDGYDVDMSATFTFNP